MDMEVDTMKKTIDEQLKQKFFEKWADSFMDDDLPLLDGMAEYFASQVKKAVNQALDEVRVKIARQLEMTVLHYEKDINDLADGKTSGVVESLESKIRAFIRLELNQTIKKLKEEECHCQQ